MRTLKIQHSTTFRHGSAAVVSWQMLRLQPRQEANQELLEYELAVTPAQHDMSCRRDYFGNTVHRFTTRAATDALKITATARVRLEGVALPSAERTLEASAIREAAEARVASGDFLLQQYREATPAVPFLPGALDFAIGIDSAMPALSWIASLGKAFAEHYTFDAKATELSTPLHTVVEKRRGVCQDFSHVFISCLRQLGVPAGYVSGYLLTNPPPGKPRLRGVDAMHAWVSIWLPDLGWVDYDPTNHCFVDEDHIVVARGRDYSDVSPIRGVFRGAARHAGTSQVTVEPEPSLEPDGLPGGTAKSL